MTKTTSEGEVRGWVLYDAECARCLRWARRFEKVLGRRQFALAPLQAPWVRERMGWGSWKDWVPLVGSLVAALVSGAVLARWAYMWALSFALFFGCKWLTWRRARREGAAPTTGRSLAYLLGWPGMDADAFLRDNEAQYEESVGQASCLPVHGASLPRVLLGNRHGRQDAARTGRLEACPTLNRHEAQAKPAAADWWFALGKTVLGVVLIWSVVRRVVVSAPILGGWVSLVGIVFVLHFGFFHLLALAWRCAGIDAQPIMRAPIRATSLGEFWGRRWNLAFHLLVQEFAFRPLSRFCGRGAALLGVFLVSGLIHELVISLPAGGGFGLPTAYFLIQGTAVLGERSGVGRRFGLGRGWVGWLFTMIVTAGPAFWLFHPPFIHNVILPFLKVIHAY